MSARCWWISVCCCSIWRRWSAIWEDRLGAFAGFFAAVAAKAAGAATRAAPRIRMSVAACRRWIRPPARRMTSEQNVRPEREDGPRLSRLVKAEIRAGRRLVDVQQMEVQAPLAGGVGIEVRSPAELPRMTMEVVPHVRGGAV